MSFSLREQLEDRLRPQYSIDRELGQGAMAVVFRARDLKHDRWVALKVLRRELSQSLQAERFLREIRIAGGLSHPHIVPIHDSGGSGDLLYYVMPFVEGESLRRHLDERTRLSVDDALRIAAEVASALHYAHRHGVVHRDVKPENILLADNHAVVADFGLARAVTSASDESLTQPGLAVGTAAYISPEQAAGESDVDGRSDVYSLGCVLYEMLAGRPPFTGQNVQAVIAKRFSEPVPSIQAVRPGVAPAVEYIVQRALAKEPATRFASAGQLAISLVRASRSMDPRITPTGLEEGREAGLEHVEARWAPVAATPFVGRASAVSDVKLLLGHNQLVTILGPGGVGKSRLGFEIAAKLAGEFRDGRFMVPLSGVMSPQYLAASIAEALGLGATGGRDPRLQVLAFVERRNALLLLDNFEHLVGGAPLLTEIAANAPDVRILVTSRERLNIQPEVAYDLGALPVPERDDAANALHSPSVELFVAHARRYGRSFEASSPDLADIGRICRLVGGLPLGIEMAAGLLRALDCREIVAELEKNLDVLVTPLREAPERHRTLRAVFEQSWQLLADSERESLARLSVFEGGFDRASAEQVTGASLAVLTELIDKSLLGRSRAGRYELHDVIRQYSAAKLAASPERQQEVHATHAMHFADYMRLREERLVGRDQQAALDEIADELGNIRAGWKWAQSSGDHQLLERYARGLYRYYMTRGWFREGADDLEFAEHVDDSSVLAGKLLAWYGAFWRRLGMPTKARALYRRSLTILRSHGTDAETVLPMRGLANLATDLGKYRAAYRLHRRCVDICRRVADAYELALSLNDWASPLMELGRYEDAEARLHEAIVIQTEIGNSYGLALSLLNLSNCLTLQHRIAEAKRPLEAGLKLGRELGSRYLVAAASTNLAYHYRHTGQPEKADRLRRESIEQFREIGLRDGLATALVEAGEAAVEEGRYHEAAALFREALTVAVQIQATAIAARILIGMAELFARTGERGRALTLLDAALHHSATREEDMRKARELFREISATTSSDTAGQRTSTRQLQSIVGELLAER